MPPPYAFSATSGHVYKCPKCQTELQSRNRHDFAACGCPNSAFVDGGADYIRLGAKTREDFPVLVHRNPLLP